VASYWAADDIHVRDARPVVPGYVHCAARSGGDEVPVAPVTDRVRDQGGVVREGCPVVEGGRHHRVGVLVVVPQVRNVDSPVGRHSDGRVVGAAGLGQGDRRGEVRAAVNRPGEALAAATDPRFVDAVRWCNRLLDLRVLPSAGAAHIGDRPAADDAAKAGNAARPRTAQVPVANVTASSPSLVLSSPLRLPLLARVNALLSIGLVILSGYWLAIGDSDAFPLKQELYAPLSRGAPRPQPELAR